jgi:hypothetical protein
MKVLLSLAFDEGDDRELEYALSFVNGGAVVLSHAMSQATVPLEYFQVDQLFGPTAAPGDET